MEHQSTQLTGAPVAHWKPPPLPRRQEINGEYCSLVPLNSDHASELYEAFRDNHSDRHWTYLPYGPFSSFSDFEHWVSNSAASSDPQFYTVFLKDANTSIASGIASYLRIKADSGSIEVGHIHYASRLQNTSAATEAMFLMMKNAFSLGYRRYEWKCDALNKPSCTAAERLGFTFEGVFRQATVVKGRNRDTAWFSIIDSEWAALQTGYEKWLAAENFDASGNQRKRLGECLAG